MVLSEGQVKDFNDKGVIVVKGFYSPDEVARLSAWLDELQSKDPVDEAEAKYYEQSPVTGDDVLVRVENVLGDQNPEITDLMLSTKLRESLSQLLGEEAILFKEKVNYKLPGCRPDKLHQDQAAGWNVYADFFVTMAVAIDENRLENAALTFLTSGNYEKDLMGEEWKPLTTQDPPFEPAHEYSLLEADPGDVIFFDSYVPHGSPANTSGAARRNIYLTFNRESAGDQRMRYYHDKWKNYAPNQAGESRTADEYRV